MWRLPRERPTSWPTIIPPRAGEITVSQSNLRSLSASHPQTLVAISVSWRRSAHWKYCRLCKPERNTKCPSSSAPVFRKSASNSLLMKISILARSIADGPLIGDHILIRHGDGFDFDACTFRQSGDLHGRAGRRRLFEIRPVDLVHSLKVSQIGKENCGFNNVLKTYPPGL